jgi:hypothetical protein
VHLALLVDYHSLEGRCLHFDVFLLVGEILPRRKGLGCCHLLAPLWFYLVLRHIMAWFRYLQELICLGLDLERQMLLLHSVLLLLLLRNLFCPRP